MNTLIKTALQYEIGHKRARKPKLLNKVAVKRTQTGPKWGVVTNGALKQPKTMNFPDGGGKVPIMDESGKPVKIKPKKDPRRYRPHGSVRKMKSDNPKLSSGTGESAKAGRKMKSSKPKLSTNGSVRKMKPGNPKKKLTTGGMRTMSKKPLKRFKGTGEAL